MANSGETVTVLLYDLSQGMAKTLSLGMTGTQIDGIWHTSVVLYGREYCFGQGIEVFRPGTAPYGQPVERIPMGTTLIPKEVWLEYIDNMKEIWTRDKYHLLDNNCNSFTDEVCLFLVGKGIPKHVCFFLNGRLPVFLPSSSTLPWAKWSGR